MNEWLGKAGDLAENLASEAMRHEPVCFVLGAGGSLSSGAPFTWQIIEAFDRMFGGRLADAGAAERRRAIDLFLESEKRAAIEPLFREVVPYVGYRCLAAMGRDRRVFVLNLNWDVAVELACRTLNTPVESVSLEEGADRVRSALTAPGPGVTVVHLHGQWDREVKLRYGTMETLSFADEAQRLLLDHALCHTTIVVGASLADDTDMHELLDALADERPSLFEQRPWWMFVRGDGPSPAVRARLQQIMVERGSSFNWVPDDHVDADRLLVALRAAEVVADRGEDAGYEKLRRRSAWLDLPPLDETVWPRPSLLRASLDEPVVALVGEAGLGKSTIAHLLAFWRTLWSTSEGRVDTLSGTSSALNAVATAAGVPAADHGQLVVEDPFGQETFDANPAFMSALRQLATRSEAPGAIVTSRLANWHRGFSEQDHDALPDSALSESDPQTWYEADALLRFLRSRGELELAKHEEAVRERELNTPHRINLQLDAGFPPDPDDPGNTRDKVSLLTRLFGVPSREGLALVVVLARLQELSERPQTMEELLAMAGDVEAIPAWKQVRSMLFQYPLDGARRIKLHHSTDRAAVDEILHVRRDVVASRLAALGAPARWARQALSVWDALQAAREEATWSIERVPAEVRAAWGAPLVVQAVQHSRDRGWQTIEGLLDDPGLDFWALCEVVYETLRLWRLLSGDAARADAFVRRVLDDRKRMGAYALLEAMLYLQVVTPPELWSRLEEEVVTLARGEGGDFELALIFDGLLWRPPAVGDDAKQRLFGPLLEAAEARHGLAGAFRLACAYHLPGAMYLAERTGLYDPGEQPTPFDEAQAEQAARMVRFHFVHQSRARVALARRPFEGGTIEYLFQTLYERRLDPRQGERLTQLVEQLAGHASQAGWAVHLALNVGATQGTFSDGQLRRIAACLPGDVDNGVLSAAVTYEAPPNLARKLSQWFGMDPRRREAALDRVRDGFPCDEWTVRPPRFKCVRDVGVMWTLLGCDWPKVSRLAEVPTHDPRALVLKYEMVAERAVTERGADPALVEVLLERARVGDLRDFELAAQARDGDDPHLRSLVGTANWLRQNQGDLF